MMNGIKRNSRQRATEYTVSYSDMKGVDLSASYDSGRTRYSHIENMYRDYDSGTNQLESIPGFRRIAVTNGKINSLFSQKAENGENFIIAHSKKSLYRFSLNDKDSTVNPEAIAEVNDTHSSAFTVGSELYVMDGQKITVIDGGGTVGTVGEGKYTPYIPTTYVNGTEYQQPNLLTDKFTERFYVSSSADFYDATPELEFMVTSESMRQCAVVGINSSFIGGTVYIPAYTYINGEKYRITEITDAAFIKNNKILTMIISEGLIKIGYSAFRGCQNIFKVVIPDSVTEISRGTFSNCPKLTTVYLGSGIQKIGSGAFLGCDKLEAFYYSADSTDFSAIQGAEEVNSQLVTYNTKYYGIRVKIPLYTPSSAIDMVKVDDVPHEFSTVKTNQSYSAIILLGTNKCEFDRKNIEITATLDVNALRSGSTASGLYSILPSSLIGSDAVTRCTISESFDGRIFLSGNPGLPNTVIYSERDEFGVNTPLYFGAYNYFNDGIGSFPVIGLLSAGDTIAVFKSDDDGCGSIFYHKPTLTDSDVIPKIYPVSNVHSGISAIGAQASFRDDPVFISKYGLCALSRGSIEPERSIYCRSHNVNPLLLSENLEKISLSRWRGYLALFAGGRVYLADSRATFKHPSGDIEYEWYLLNGIGTYRGDETVYKYTSKVTSPEYKIHPEKIDRKAYSEEVIADLTAKGYVYYVPENGEKYEVFPTG